MGEGSLEARIKTLERLYQSTYSREVIDEKERRIETEIERIKTELREKRAEDLRLRMLVYGAVISAVGSWAIGFLVNGG